MLNSDSLNAAYGNYPGDPNSILGSVLGKYPGVTPIKGGEAKDMEESIPALMTGGILVMVMIYALLAIPSRATCSH